MVRHCYDTLSHGMTWDTTDHKNIYSDRNLENVFHYSLIRIFTIFYDNFLAGSQLIELLNRGQISELGQIIVNCVMWRK
jgi:hypothetical protein